MFGVVGAFVISKKKDFKSAEGNLVGGACPLPAKINTPK
jgi:hypothetical protein